MLRIMVQFDTTIDLMSYLEDYLIDITNIIVGIVVQFDIY